MGLALSLQACNVEAPVGLGACAVEHSVYLRKVIIVEEQAFGLVGGQIIPCKRNGDGAASTQAQTPVLACSALLVVLEDLRNRRGHAFKICSLA